MPVVVLSVLIITVAPLASTPGNLEEAIALYESARYVEALEMLDGLAEATDESGGTAAASEKVLEYRALCLLALERESEAQAVVERFVVARPAYRPRGDDLPPRLVALVERARARHIPDIVRSEYREGKAGFDRKDYAEAGRHFEKVVSLGDLDGMTPAVRDSLADLTVLASGFLELIARTASGPRVADATPLPGVEPSPEAVSAAAGHVYDHSDPGVVPPVTIRQDVPRWTYRIGARMNAASTLPTGAVEVTVDVDGQVETARLLTPIHPLYDPRLLAAARRWQYQPATRDGKAVKFRKVVRIKIVAGEPS